MSVPDTISRIHSFIPKKSGDYGRLGHVSDAQQQDEEAIAANSFRPKLVGSLMMTGTGILCVGVYNAHIFIYTLLNQNQTKIKTDTGARVRLISAGGAHAAAVVDPSTGEEKGQEEEEGLKAMYGASPTLSPGASWVRVISVCSYVGMYYVSNPDKPISYHTNAHSHFACQVHVPGGFPRLEWDGALMAVWGGYIGRSRRVRML